jgi:hypothetical protein
VIRSLARRLIATARQDHIPAPMGGLNTVDGGFMMPETDCPLLYNAIGAENGLRSRFGTQEWCTGLLGIADNTVRTVLPFTGSHKNGSTNKAFSATSKGIYDATASSNAPALPVTFGTQSGDAGYGICCVVVNSSGGHFLVYCDEENGYYVYTEATTTWTKVAQQASTVWAVGTVYGANARVSNGGLTYKTAAGGTSAAAPATGPAGTGAAIVDNTVTWAYEPTINGVDPATFCFAMVWKNRLWFIQKDTGIAWYLEPGFGAGGSLFGTAVAFNFGAQFKNGGPLVGLYSWTVDGGSGPDDRLVAVSGGGDVVIYGGTNPGSATTFGLVGRWYIGPPPAGRRIATDNGGDLLLMGANGIVPASRLVAGLINPQQLYTTYKINNLFTRLVATYGSLRGWALLVHPEDNSLVVTIPTADGQPTNQLAMSLVTGGWSPYRSLPVLSMAAFGGKLYFGTADGRVCINTGYLDGLSISDANAYTPIVVSGITRFSNLGRGTQKQIMQIRANVQAEGGTVQRAIEARYNYDLSEAGVPASSSAPGGSLWDSAVWDAATWGGAYATQNTVGGAVGMGSDAAVAFKLSVTSRTVLLGFDIEFIESAGMT